MAPCQLLALRRVHQHSNKNGPEHPRCGQPLRRRLRLSNLHSPRIHNLVAIAIENRHAGSIHCVQRLKGRRRSYCSIGERIRSWRRRRVFKVGSNSCRKEIRQLLNRLGDRVHRHTQNLSLGGQVGGRHGRNLRCGGAEKSGRIRQHHQRLPRLFTRQTGLQARKPGSAKPLGQLQFGEVPCRIRIRHAMNRGHRLFQLGNRDAPCARRRQSQLNQCDQDKQLADHVASLA